MERALERLGVDEACFDDVVCFETMNPHLFGGDGQDRTDVVLKPSVDAILVGLRVAGTNPRRTVSFYQNFHIPDWPAVLIIIMF